MPPSHRPTGDPESPPDHAFTTASIGRYATELPPYDTTFIELLTKRRMREFGYLQDRPLTDARHRLRFALLHLPVNGTRMVAWQCKMRIRTSVNGLRSSLVACRTSLRGA
jgi:hypothetical protein